MVDTIALLFGYIVMIAGACGVIAVVLLWSFEKVGLLGFAVKGINREYNDRKRGR